MRVFLCVFLCVCVYSCVCVCVCVCVWEGRGGGGGAEGRLLVQFGAGLAMPESVCGCRSTDFAL